MNGNHTFTISPDVLAQEVGEEIVLLDLCTGTYFGLNATGAQMWRLFASGKSLQDVCDEMLEEFQASHEKLEADARRLAQELMARGILTTPQQ